MKKEQSSKVQAQEVNTNGIEMNEAPGRKHETGK